MHYLSESFLTWILNINCQDYSHVKCYRVLVNISSKLAWEDKGNEGYYLWSQWECCNIFEGTLWSLKYDSPLKRINHFLKHEWSCSRGQAWRSSSLPTPLIWEYHCLYVGAFLKTKYKTQVTTSLVYCHTLNTSVSNIIHGNVFRNLLYNFGKVLKTHLKTFKQIGMHCMHVKSLYSIILQEGTCIRWYTMDVRLELDHAFVKHN